MCVWIQWVYQCLTCVCACVQYEKEEQEQALVDSKLNAEVNRMEQGTATVSVVCLLFLSSVLCGTLQN